MNTFDSFKYDQFAYYYKEHNQPISPEEIYGTVNFPSIWNQNPREGLRLHWDGNNTSLRERNFSAAIGAGATPPDMDVDRLFRIEAWLKTLPPPAYPFSINEELAKQGAGVYTRMCFGCHDFKGNQVGRVIPLENIKTDRHRIILIPSSCWKPKRITRKVISGPLRISPRLMAMPPRRSTVLGASAVLAQRIRSLDVGPADAG